MLAEKKKTLIITLLIEEEAQLFFEEKRKQYFPAFANFTTAHLTLFHCLPNKAIVLQKIKNLAKRTNIFSLEVSGIVHQNSFNGYSIKSDILLELHKTLQQEFITMLSLKDIKPLKPHITIQNKTTAYKAQKTNALLIENFKEFTFNAKGISCWYYSKNKWEKEGDYFFKL
jgi:2'-5' RNA ligase superfamily